jgi:chromodomain-helicase-DNA-binding protein 4
MVTTRGTRKATTRYSGMQQWSDVELSGDSDDEVPPRRRRKTDRVSASSDDDNAPKLYLSESNTSDDLNAFIYDDSDDGVPRRSARNRKDQRTTRTKRKARYLEASDDDLDLLVSDNPRRPRKRQLRFPNVTKLSVNGRAGARRSTRVRDTVNMKEVGEDDIFRSDSDERVPTGKILGAREIFKTLARGEPFRERHMEICETCGNANNNASPLVYCQGCSLAYHKNCLGPRGGRDHLVSKVAEDDFVLQCRRCVNTARKKDPTSPDLSKCQDCKKVGPSCAAFRAKKNAAQEQREREENNGVDPITYVDPSLINNFNNVLFRCTKCWRPFHYGHLPSRQPWGNDLRYDENERADARFHEYSRDWNCKECLEMSNKKVGTIVAWRPTDVESYLPGVPLEDVGEDDMEYLIKWENISYHQVNWMPGAWVWGVASFSTRNAFAKKFPAMKLTTEAAIPEEFLSIDIVLDVKYTNIIDFQTGEIDRARIREVSKALIKYKGLPYEEAVWEKVPEPDDGSRWTDFVTAYNDWVLGRYTHLPKPAALKNRIEKVRSQKFTELEKEKQPENLVGGQLMNYQLEGLNWIYHSWHGQKNCILADEMGLGKTIQVIAWMAMMVLDINCYPFLIVVPNSTVLNWRREIKQWAPQLRVVAYYGSSKARELAHDYELFPNQKRERDLRTHVVITSYEAAIDPSSSRFFKSVPWQGLVVDEGQRLKNDKGLLHGVLSSWKVPFRLLLTGTPLQNNARELFNLLQFLDETINAVSLEEQYADMTNTKIAELHELIRPYILRRTKKQVLTFLPSMSQIIVPVTMTHLQKKLYKSILSKSPELLRVLFSQSSVDKKERSSMNNILMQLRKCLCHPFVYSKQIEERNLQALMLHRNLVEASSKLQLLELLLPKLRERGHRILIFSQFLDMLDIIEDFLEGLEMRYARLDGTVTSLEKQKRIEAFNAPDSSLFAFLLSTRAGGVGINLATADTVIILDPDFNPHQDLQALSRAHRIGQTKKVLCFQFMTRDSAEEKIVQIGRKKMALDHVIVQQLDEEDLAEKDVESILRHGAAALFGDNDDSKDIKYDDLSVEKLLDRSQIEDTKTGTDQSAESQFSFARVWANEEAQLEETLPSSEDEAAPDPGFWEQIIKDRERAAADEAAAKAEALGRGKRARMTVDYKVNGRTLTKEELAELGPSDDEEITAPATKQKHNRKRNSDSDTDFMQDEPEDDGADEDEILHISPGEIGDVLDSRKKPDQNGNVAKKPAARKFMSMKMGFMLTLYSIKAL